MCVRERERERTLLELLAFGGDYAARRVLEQVLVDRGKTCLVARVVRNLTARFAYLHATFIFLNKIFIAKIC